MMKNSTIKLGIVGAGGRGGYFKSTCDAIDDLSVHAICDVNEKGLAKSKAVLGAQEAYLDYEEMLDKSDLDAVLVGTPMQFHVSQSIAALKRDIHVLSEVPAGVSVEECKQLVETCKSSKAIYMMAENYIYMKPNQIVTELVKQGLFGTPYYAEGEYLHAIKEMSITTPWRRHWQMGIDGITYGTHSLGPILQWIPGDRVVKVCCEGAGSRQTDTEGKPYCQAASTMLCKTAQNALIKIRVDLVSDRPHAGTNYQLQGTDGCYESSRGGPGDKDKIWLRSRDKHCHWRELSLFSDVPELTEKYLPAGWREASELAKRAGHGGGDYFELVDFINAVQGKCPPPIGIHEAMDMTLPGLVSQQSIQQDGAWLPVPDSRDW